MATPLRARRPGASAPVRALPFSGDDAALVEGLKAGSSIALSALCDRYADHAFRVLARILGEDSELIDLQQDVLLRVVRSAPSIHDSSSLKGWITVIAVNVARTALKRRSLRRWLTLRPWNELPDIEAPMAAESDVLALRRTYAILARLPVSDRIVFTLRIIDGMELTEVAHACGISLATAKRRLARAEEKFTTMALTDPVLADWLKGGSRWGTP